MAETSKTHAAPITIKKYANRRLYNTATSSYVTLEHLCQMVKDNEDFVVYDAKTGEDITRSVLTQIIVEEEGKGQNLLPISFLRQLISLYGDSLADVVPRYLEMSMTSFYRNEEQMRDMMQKAVQGMFPLNQIEEMNKQNMAIFESAMKMFSPFNYKEGEAPGMAGGPPQGGTTPGNGAPKGGQGGEKAGDPVRRGQENIEELRARLNTMQHQIDELLGRGQGAGGKGTAPGTSTGTSASTGTGTGGKKTG
ncbi:polyhydroxyalkanoate synthesis repressor PhaR [Caenispirillum salinarum]|uniref:polyhydroxyalkanoate synthesis repressor PhaR n=1 Tax=Caenispirillum salinarum TaxID=859058 RepID=UPI00384FECA7